MLIIPIPTSKYISYSYLQNTLKTLFPEKKKIIELEPKISQRTKRWFVYLRLARRRPLRRSHEPFLKELVLPEQVVGAWVGGLGIEKPVVRTITCGFRFFISSAWVALPH